MKTTNNKTTRRPVKKSATPIKPKTNLLENLIQDLLTRKIVDVSDLEKLLILKAKRSFQEALLAFQSEDIIIPRDAKGVDKEGKHYSYSLLPTIRKAIQPFLLKHGFTYHWQFDRDDEYVACKCIITHTDGHIIVSTMKAEADDTASMTDLQGIGSTMTYLQRYTLVAVLGLTSVDTDDDGNASHVREREIIPGPEEIKVDKETIDEFMKEDKNNDKG